MEKIILNDKAVNLVKQANRYLRNIPHIEINNIDDAKSLKNFSENLKDFVKSLENIRLETVRPLQENVKEINSAINPTINLLDETSKKINQAIFAWQKKENEKIEAQKRAVLLEQATALAGSTKLSEGTFANTPSPIVNVGGKIQEPEKITKIKKVWKYEILIYKKENGEMSTIKDVDPEFVELSLDDKKIEEAIKAGKIKIRGLHIFQEEIPVRG